MTSFLNELGHIHEHNGVATESRLNDLYDGNATARFRANSGA